MRKGTLLFSVLCVLVGIGNARLVYKGQVKDGVGGVDGLQGASCVIVSPDGRHVYTAGPNDNAIVWFSRDPNTGGISYRGQFHSGVGNDHGAGVYDIAISSSGNEVYAMGYDASIAWFTRNALTGSLTYGGVLKDGRFRISSLRYASSFALSSDGKQCYIGKVSDSLGIHAINMAWFNRSQTDGSLTPGGDLKFDFNTPYYASWLCVSSDDKTVYATSALDSAVLWFNRDGSTGALSLGGILKGGMKGMAGALGVTTSNDGKNVYIASVFSSALAWFARNPSSGQLTYKGSFPDNSYGSDIADMNGTWSVVVSPNGRHIYVVSILGYSITSFSRDLVTGAPTFEGTIKGIPGFGGPTCIALDPMGKHVYVTGSWDSTVSWFEEDDPATPVFAGSPSADTSPAFSIVKQGGGIEVSYTTGVYGDNRVKLVVTTLDGRLVRNFFEGPEAPGAHRHAWDFRSGCGSRVSPGMYLCALTSAASGVMVRGIVVGK